MMSRQAFRPAVLCALLLAAGLSVPAQTAAPEPDPAALREKLQAKLLELHKNGNFPGATLGVALADGRSMGVAAGVSDREARTPMRPADLMLQGSVGKTYAAALAMQLVADG